MGSCLLLPSRESRSKSKLRVYLGLPIVVVILELFQDLGALIEYAITLVEFMGLDPSLSPGTAGFVPFEEFRNDIMGERRGVCEFAFENRLDDTTIALM